MTRVVAFIVALLALSLLAPIATAQDASPVASPGAAACLAPELPPGTPTPMDMDASPEAEMEEAMASPEGELPVAEASPAIPSGQPASDEQASRVEEALQNLAACSNAGEYVAYAALFTEQGLLEECGTTNIYDAEMCFGGIPPIVDVTVSDVQVHDDGRLSADVTYTVGAMQGHERFFLAEQSDGMLLVDASPELPVAVPENATVISGEMADYEFILSESSAPAGTVAFEVANTGEYPHELVVLQLPEGVTIEQLFADESLFAQVQFFGFTYADPEQDAPPLVLSDLQPGVYTLICFIDEPEGIPHVMRGMVAEFTVTDA